MLGSTTAQTESFSLASESSMVLTKVPLGTPEQGVEPALLKKPKPLAMLRVTCCKKWGSCVNVGASGKLQCFVEGIAEGT